MPRRRLPVVNPANEETLYEIALGSAADVDKAVAAARRAFETFSLTTREQRVELLSRIIEVYKKRMKEIGGAISDEMGAPLGFAEKFQAGAGLGHIMTTLDVLKSYPFEEPLGSAMLVREPVGVVGMITPWNWPLNQIACKVAPALAAGCTMILKPSEYTPTSALIFAEILHEAGVPKGVFNLINGLGPEVGAAMSTHPGIDMMSFTGSTRAGIDVVQKAAPTVKRVTQELGGKSPNVILEDADLAKAITGGTAHCFNNSGQSCNAPTRMLVPLAKMKEAAAIAKAVADKAKPGDPRAEGTTMGPVVNRVQWEKIQGLIKKGIDEGATLVTGGLGLPEGLNKGFYVRPTVFADVTNDMTIAREEIFGPVLSIIGYKNEDDAVQHRQRHALRPRRLRLRRQRGERTPRGAPPPRRQRQPQRRAERAVRALRRLQAVGQRPRVGPLRRRGISRGQGRGRLGRLDNTCHPGQAQMRASRDDSRAPFSRRSSSGRPGGLRISI